MEPLISIIVPVYNVERYLGQCMDSIIAQNYTNFEVLGVDDKSQDASLRIFEEYSCNDSRFTLLHHTENLGLPSARNTGIKSARGEYLFFLDSDDWISPHALKSLCDLAQQDEVDIALGGVLKCWDEDGRAHPANHAAYMKEKFHAVTIFDTPVIGRSIISCNKLIKTDFVNQQNLIFRREPRRFEDMLTYKWYLSGAKISTTNDITYFYRQRAGDVDSQSIMQGMDIIVLKDKLLAFADITEFLVERGHFLTEHDPLNNEKGLIYLPRALVWILKGIVEYYNDGITEEDRVILALRAFKKLVSNFTKDYIKILPKEVRLASEYLATYQFSKAIKKIKALYK